MFNKYEKNINKKQDLPEITFSEMEIKDELVRKNIWKNRRRMAWISFLTIIASVLFFMFKTDITSIQADGIKYLCFFLSSVVLAYIGGNVVERIKGK